jgi:hypothetical protein
MGKGGNDANVHLEKNLIILLSSLGLDLLSELDDRLELGVVLLGLWMRNKRSGSEGNFEVGAEFDVE